jgi:hypothetical protein
VDLHAACKEAQDERKINKYEFFLNTLPGLSSLQKHFLQEQK